jgi:hypothetical protein
VRFQDHRQRGHKVYALHAPEVECIGKGKAKAPYEFGCKVSIATPATKPRGGQFVLHAKALHGNPFDGHTLGPVIDDLERPPGTRLCAVRGTQPMPLLVQSAIADELDQPTGYVFGDMVANDPAESFTISERAFEQGLERILCGAAASSTAAV